MSIRKIRRNEFIKVLVFYFKKKPHFIGEVKIVTQGGFDPQPSEPKSDILSS